VREGVYFKLAADSSGWLRWRVDSTRRTRVKKSRLEAGATSDVLFIERLLPTPPFFVSVHSTEFKGL